MSRPLTPCGKCCPAMSSPSGDTTRLANGIVKTGVMRKFSHTHRRKNGSEASASAAEYVGVFLSNGGSLLSISLTSSVRYFRLCKRWYKSKEVVALVVCVPAILVRGIVSPSYMLVYRLGSIHKTECFSFKICLRKTSPVSGFLALIRFVMMSFLSRPFCMPSLSRRLLNTACITIDF